MASPRSLDDALRWMDEGTSRFLACLGRLSDDRLDEPGALDGWTGKHLLAHVAANAEALGHLVHWARTGEETPMYSSQAQRNADIERGSAHPPAVLRRWVEASADGLAQGLGTLTSQHWSREVRTAQGREVAATEVPWMRAREVMVHAVDLGAGDTFADLPEDFLLALVEDIVVRRAAVPGPAVALTTIDGARGWTVPGSGEPISARGPLAGLAAYLAGRPTTGVTRADGHRADPLPAWL